MIEGQRVNEKREKTIKRPSFPGKQIRDRILSIVFCSYFISNTKELQEGKFPKRKTAVFLPSARLQLPMEKENSSILVPNILRGIQIVKKKAMLSLRSSGVRFPMEGKEKDGFLIDKIARERNFVKLKAPGRRMPLWPGAFRKGCQFTC